ncbi:MAG: hypothetical protein M2R45_00007 [Verrucomicrobia subdivision 3 bacterium]|nr:hypothetical protein [Limisphaerales bacterium]MCS1412533.1 hypothetical protein [Limisphaerales bacterium]
MPEINLGWPPGCELAQLVGISGKAHALDLHLTGGMISSRQASEWRLVHEIVPPFLLMRRAND